MANPYTRRGTNPRHRLVLSISTVALALLLTACNTEGGGILPGHAEGEPIDLATFRDRGSEARSGEEESRNGEAGRSDESSSDSGSSGENGEESASGNGQDSSGSSQTSGRSASSGRPGGDSRASSGDDSGGDSRQQEQGGKSVTVSWTAPSTRANGRALGLSEIERYALYLRKSGDSYGSPVNVRDNGRNRHVLNSLSSGTYYVAMRTIDTRGRSSRLSDEVRFRVQ